MSVTISIRCVLPPAASPSTQIHIVNGHCCCFLLWAVAVIHWSWRKKRKENRNNKIPAFYRYHFADERRERKRFVIRAIFGLCAHSRIRLKSTSNQEHFSAIFTMPMERKRVKQLRVTTAVNRRCCHKSTHAKTLRTQQKLTSNMKFRADPKKKEKEKEDAEEKWRSNKAKGKTRK